MACLKLVPFILIFAILLGIIITTISLLAVFIPQGSISSTNLTVSIENIQNYSNTIASFGTRVPNTIGNNKTRNYLVDILLKKNFQVELDTFTQDTVIGQVTFSNVIGTWNKPTNHSKRIIIAAHYDSKIFTNFNFIGATDSIVPCGMMIDLIDFVVSTYKWKFDIQFVFFDGEEAFIQWTGSDSIYGSRHLAAKWERENNLSNIELFILLDLIGGRSPRFYNLPVHYNTGTSGKFADLVNTQASYTNANYFMNVRSYDNIEDDHIPFEQRRVPILHLISVPFPSVWHQVTDTMANIDWESVKSIQIILKNYLFNKFT